MKKLAWVGWVLLMGCDHGGLNDKYIRYTIENQTEGEVELRVYPSSVSSTPSNQYTIAPNDSLVWDKLIIVEEDIWFSNDAMGGDSVRFEFPNGDGRSYPCRADSCSEKRGLLEYYFALKSFTEGIQVDSIHYVHTILGDAE